jgi:asparagine synthase (glutamine-hydrolysing)
MPGIIGLITRMPPEQAKRELSRMVGVLCHESFYVAGTWAEESLGVYVGWVARKGSFSDGMPLRNERGDVVLVFGGEEFPEPGTAQRLRERGHQVDLHGCSYLAHLYEEDPSFPSGLNGRFHGLLTDRSRGTAMLFNDRFGMQRIYYHESKDAFYFAAEAKAILAVRPELRKLNPRALGEFISCGAVMENRTLFEGVELLPPASAWIFRNGSLDNKSNYFHPREWEEQESLDPESYYRELREVFSQNLPRYFEGNERIAMSLTGGLDTRMVMAWQQSESGSLPCYTFGSMFRENYDVRVARRVANACNQPFQVVTIGDDFLSRFPYYAEKAVFVTDGTVDVGVSPDLYLHEKAREIAPVRMTGLYGGEILRRVRTFKPEEPVRGLFAPEVLVYTHQARETFGKAVSGHPLTFAAFKQQPWHLCGIWTMEQMQLSVRTPFLDNDMVRTVYRAPQSSIISNEGSLRLIAEGKSNLLQIPTDRGLAGDKGRLSRAVHQGFLEFLFKAEYAYDVGMPQVAARMDHALSALHLERLFLGRHKIFHFRIWYRDMLAQYVQEILLDPRTLSRPIFARAGIEAMVQGHVKGNRNYTAQIHKVLSLELLHRVFLDPACWPPPFVNSSSEPEVVSHRSQ